MLFGFSINSTIRTGIQHTATMLTQFQQDLAFFLLARGDYAYAGWGQWGMTWPFQKEPADGELPPLPYGVPLPKEFFDDYGIPTDPVCIETHHQPGVFRRKWSKVRVELDCNQFSASIVRYDNDNNDNTINTAQMK